MMPRLPNFLTTKPALAVLSALAFILVGCDELQPPASGKSAVVGETLIVALVADPKLAAGVRRAGSERDYTFVSQQRLDGLGLVMVSFQRPKEVSAKQAIDALETAVPGSTVGVNHAYRLQQAQPATDRRTYANTTLNWTSGACRATGPVGLIDTGIDRNAPQLAQARVFAQRFARGTPAAANHGTNVASVLADATRLKGLTIYSADVMSVDAGFGVAGGAEALIRALDWFAANKVRVVNMSMSGPYNKLLDVAVMAANERGMILVAAVGNSEPDVAAQYPAGFPSVIAVTAVDANQRLYRQAVRGAHVDFAAPGVDIFVPSATGGQYVTGTSMAAPMVTARIIADRKLKAARNAGDLLPMLTDQAIDLGPKGVDPKFGAGLIQGPTDC
jgi:hypothetical protein